MITLRLNTMLLNGHKLLQNHTLPLSHCCIHPLNLKNVNGQTEDKEELKTKIRRYSITRYWLSLLYNSCLIRLLLSFMYHSSLIVINWCTIAIFIIFEDRLYCWGKHRLGFIMPCQTLKFESREFLNRFWSLLEGRRSELPRGQKVWIFEKIFW